METPIEPEAVLKENAPESPMVKLMGLGWLVCGVFVLASFFLPQYKILNEGLDGWQLIRALDRDLADVAKFIGEFTTFMMYFSVFFAMVAGVVSSVTGARALLYGGKRNWLPVMIVALFAFGFQVFTAVLLDSGDSAAGLAFFAAKFKPEPAWAFYAGMFLFALMGVLNLVLNIMGLLPSRDMSKDSHTI